MAESNIREIRPGARLPYIDVDITPAEETEILDALLEAFGPKMMDRAIKLVRDMERSERRLQRSAKTATAAIRYRERADALMAAANALLALTPRIGDPRK